MASATLANNTCGTFGDSEHDRAAAPAQSEPSGCYRYTLTGIDNVGNSASVSTTVKVDTTAPSTPSLAFSGLSANTYYNASTNTLYFRPATGGAFTVTASSTDADTGILGYTFSSLSGRRLHRNADRRRRCVYAFGVDRHAAGQRARPCSRPATRAPARPARPTACGRHQRADGRRAERQRHGRRGAGSSSYNTTGSFTIGTRTEYSADTGSGLLSSVLTRATGKRSANACSGYGTPTTITGNPSQSGLAEGCYLYTLTGTDRVGNIASSRPPSRSTKPPRRRRSASRPTPTARCARDLQRDRRRLGRERCRPASSSAPCATYTPATNTCGTFAAYANIGAAGPTSPYTDSTRHDRPLLRVRVHGAPTTPATPRPRRRAPSGSTRQTER